MFWLQREQMSRRTCAPSDDSGQPAHHFWIANEVKFLNEDNEGSDQTARMRRLIWDFVGRTYQKVRFLTLKLVLLPSIEDKVGHLKPKGVLKAYNNTIDQVQSVLGPGILYSSTNKNEPANDKTYKMACAPSEDSDQPGHPPSLIWVFAVLMKKAWVWVLSYLLGTQRRLWSDWAEAQADLSLRWAHMPFCRFYAVA